MIKSEHIEHVKSSVSRLTIWKIAVPIILGMLAQTIVSLTDTAFLGRLGEVELGAASMAGIYYFCFATLAWGFAIGEQIIVARRLGEKAYDKIGVVLVHGLIFVMPLALLLFSILKFGSPFILKSFLSSENVYNVSTEFISYRCYGIFFACINFMYRSFYIGLSKTRSIGYSTILMALVNVFLDWALIFGTPFNEPMGVKGAAIASVCAEISATIFFFIYTGIIKPIKDYPIYKFFKFDFDIVKKIYNLSIPTMMQKMASFGIWLAFFFIIENTGERNLAITMVARSAFMLISIPAFAFGATANTLTSRLIGEGKIAEVKSTLWKIIRQSVIMTSLAVGLVLLFPNMWINIYTDSAAIAEGTLPILYLLCFVIYTYCLGIAFFEAVSGTGYTKYALYLEIIALVIYISTTWFYAHFNYPLLWIWSSEIWYGSVLTIASYLFLKYYKWYNKKV